MPIAITRAVSPAMGNCELTYLPRARIDTGLAARQHAEYLAALSAAGCRVLTLEAEPDLPDSVFVEDTALVLDELAVLCRPGAASRRPETVAIGQALTEHRTVIPIQPPGTLDGGDLLCIGKTIYAGLSGRSNRDGIEQLSHIVSRHGYAVRAVGVSGCLHLKSAVSLVAPETLLINPAWVDPSVLGASELIEVDHRETHAANVLLLERNAIMSAAFPRTMERLLANGIEVRSVDVSEMQKAEGGVTCCSLILY
jgi:dimethylargininase